MAGATSGQEGFLVLSRVHLSFFPRNLHLVVSCLMGPVLLSDLNARLTTVIFMHTELAVLVKLELELRFIKKSVKLKLLTIFHLGEMN